MSDGPPYLERIVPVVRRRLEERRARVPQAELEGLSAPGSRPSFKAAVGTAGLALIAEVKRASPSKGPLRPALQVGELVEEYESAGARAVSVLTEEDFFQGSLADLHTAREHTRLPLLRKDFIVDAYQVHEARVAGASAVLLIAALLDDRQLGSLARLARDLGMDVLLEVHDAGEMARALALDGVVIGINNRDLRTFVVSLDTTARLAGLVPPDRVLVSESGVRSREDVMRLAALGVDGALVGERLLLEADVKKAIHGLFEPAPPVAVRWVDQVREKEAG